MFFGRYAALVTGYPDADASRARAKNEEEWINTDDLRGPQGSSAAITRAVWQYFASYVPFWLERTGLPSGRPTAEQVSKGIDGLRADFGQGMPPQFWEYCINVARSHKWNFVFIAESLDGGEVTYRSNRHFDILNENIVFPWKEASDTSAHAGIFEQRRSAYGQGLVLLNNTSHDEAGYADPWQAFIRYAVGGSMDGAPMIMYGQEIGTADAYSFDHYELNFGKYIPHFKRWNSMQPQWTAWSSNALGAKNLFPAYSSVGKARESSAALRSSNRYFLSTVGTGSPDPGIFAVAKFASKGSPVSLSDSVLAFVSLDRSAGKQNSFAIPPQLADDIGLRTGRVYNVKNLSAFLGPSGEYPTRRDAFLWSSSGRSRSDIVANGVYVSLNPVPATDAAWGYAPFEAQYLRLYDVTTPPPVPSSPQVSSPYTVDGKVTVSWSPPSDPDGPPPVYQVVVRDGQGAAVGSFSTSDNSLSLDNLEEGGSYTFAVVASNPNDPTKTAVSSPTSNSVLSLPPLSDYDGDGQANASEVVAGTNPLDANSLFKADILHDGRKVVVSWNAVEGRKYSVQRRTSLGGGSWSEGTLVSGLSSGNYTDDSPPSPKAFYRVVVE